MSNSSRRTKAMILLPRGCLRLTVRNRYVSGATDLNRCGTLGPMFHDEFDVGRCFILQDLPSRGEFAHLCTPSLFAPEERSVFTNVVVRCGDRSGYPALPVNTGVIMCVLLCGTSDLFAMSGWRRCGLLGRCLSNYNGAGGAIARVLCGAFDHSPFDTYLLMSMPTCVLTPSNPWQGWNGVDVGKTWAPPCWARAHPPALFVRVRNNLLIFWLGG